MKTCHIKRLSTLVLSTLLLGGITAPVFAFSQDVKIGSSGFLAASQSNATAIQLKQVMRGIAMASADLKLNHPTAAKESLQQAQTALKEISDRYGNGTASVFISAKHQRLGSSPLDAEREPFMKSLRRLDAAKSELAQGRFEAAAQTVDDIDYPLVFAAIDIPLSQTQSRIATALTLLKAGKTTAAQQLLEAEQNIPLTSSGVFAGNFGTS